MDAFNPKMFGELQGEADRVEFEAWLDSTLAVEAVEVKESEWTEPFDWTDTLQRHNDAADALQMEYAKAARQELQEEADWDRWESYYAQWE